MDKFVLPFHGGPDYTNGVMPALLKRATHCCVIWLSVLSTDPSHSDYLPPAEAEAYDGKRGRISTVLLMDQNGIIGHAYGARTTPGMFVISATGVVVYGDNHDHPPMTLPWFWNHITWFGPPWRTSRRVGPPPSRAPNPTAARLEWCNLTCASKIAARSSQMAPPLAGASPQL